MNCIQRNRCAGFQNGWSWPSPAGHQETDSGAGDDPNQPLGCVSPRLIVDTPFIKLGERLEMRNAPISRTTLLAIVFPVVGWTLLSLGVALIVAAFFPPPIPSQPFIDIIPAPTPIVSWLFLGIVLSVLGLSMIARSKSDDGSQGSNNSTNLKDEASGTWTVLDIFADQPTAEAVVELLKRGGVPAKVEVDSPVPGLVEDIRIVVSRELLHRAKWIVNQEPVSPQELEYAATGKLPDSENSER